MKLSPNTPNRSAMTLLEVLIVLFVVALLAGALLPAVSKAKPRSSRINCVSNLKQIGLAWRMWSGDHSDKFPWEVKSADGGTAEFAETPETYRHFVAASNELNSPKVLAC